jgi:hypothetical protein
MHQRLWVVSGIAVSLLVGCGSDMHVQTATVPDKDLSGYQTWAFVPGMPKTTGDPRVDNTAVVGNIRSAVARELAAKGYVQADSGAPDFFVNHHAALQDKLDVATLNDHYDYPYYGGSASLWGYMRPYGNTQAVSGVEEISVGSLVLDVLDGKTNDIVWRGFAEAELSRDEASHGDGSRINEAVQRMFKEFPSR